VSETLDQDKCKPGFEGQRKEERRIMRGRESGLKKTERGSNGDREHQQRYTWFKQRLDKLETRGERLRIIKEANLKP